MARGKRILAQSEPGNRLNAGRGGHNPANMEGRIKEMNAKTDFEQRWSAAMDAMQTKPAREREALCAEALKLANKTGATTAVCIIAVMEATA